MTVPRKTPIPQPGRNERLFFNDHDADTAKDREVLQTGTAKEKDAAWDRIFARHEEPAVRFVLYKSRGAVEDEAFDIVQNAFM